MRAKRNNIDIVFRQIPPELIIREIINYVPKCTEEEKVSYRKIPMDLFVNLSGWSDSGYSRNEREEQYNLLLGDMRKNYAGQSGEPSVFNLLYGFSNTVLRTDRFVPICKYSELLKWQDSSHYLGQDLFTTAFLAANDCKNATMTDYFAWNSIIKTSNARLSQILKNGIAENHYHLKGSSQCFPLTWASVMNYPEIIENKINSLKFNLQKSNSFGKEYNVVSWDVRLFWAAAIRAYLFKVIQKINIPGDKDKLFKRLRSSETREISVLLSALKIELTTLQYEYGLKFPYDKTVLDYAILKTTQQKDLKYNRILSGERQFMYQCFLNSFNNSFSVFENNLLYAYILIKSVFRCEFIQTNNDIGFKNFELYQDKKLIFPNQINDYSDETIRLALNSPLHYQPIESLEARIMPEENPKKLVKQILNIDKIFDTCENDVCINYDPQKTNYYIDDRTDKKYFFVIHYPKGKFELENKNSLPKPRNFKQREENEKCTLALINALEGKKYLRDAIKGIDACSNEIGCRPEVFARDFRLLRKVIPEKKKGIYGFQEMPVQLGITYHAGEDFLNITDGLRAIDEAIHFLNLHHGDRLGHALALGIDTRQYYKSKNHRIIMPKQDILDDDVWLLYRAYELNIPVETALERELLLRIDKNIRYIYGGIFKRKLIICWNADTYFCSWKLRGDYPNDYIKGYYKESDKPISPFYQFNKNNVYPESDFRLDSDIAMFYYAYHYDYDVKKLGMETDIIKITPAYISLVEAVQYKMQHIIAEKGIMIECNPTSNYLIGTIERYDEHPITTFNNWGLEFREDKIEACAQICVSINTDDQGVFDTSLENEYAIIASALENKKDINGNRVYSPEHVYQYIENIRQMGFQQSFNNLNSK